MAENKVVIKINYDKYRTGNSVDAPKMITVWHTRRIMICLSILALIITLLFVLTKNDTNTHSTYQDNLTSTEAPTINPDTHNTSTSSQQNPANSPTAYKPDSASPDESSKKTYKVHTPEAIIFDRRVIRASLNTVIKDNEPYEPLTGILKLTENQRISLFYFTQLKTGSGLFFHHLWWKDGKLIYDKTLTIKENKNKLVSTKNLTYKDKGEWRIQLADRTGKVLSEVNFAIDTE